MGMYTDFRLQVQIERYNPDKFLRYKDDHPFFEKERALHITDNATVNRHILEVNCSIKNYGNEIESFLSYIKPFIVRTESPKLIGYYIYENDYIPTLIYTPISTGRNASE
jgi:hypothetical protein